MFDPYVLNDFFLLCILKGSNKERVSLFVRFRHGTNKSI